jgi:hypothetical protein
LRRPGRRAGGEESRHRDCEKDLRDRSLDSNTTHVG